MTPDTRPDRTARRPFLAAAGAVGLAALAGCTEALGTTRLDWVGEAVDADGREHHHLFGSDRDVTLSVRQTASVASEDDPVPIQVLLHHRRGLRTERLRLRLRAPPRDGNLPVAPIEVRAPVATDTVQTVRRDPDGWTVVELGPTAGAEESFGRANLGLEFSLHPTLPPVESLLVGVDATLRETGPLARRFECRRTVDYPLVW
jgi:hypothetical protein